MGGIFIQNHEFLGAPTLTPTEPHRRTQAFRPVNLPTNFTTSAFILKHARCDITMISCLFMMWRMNLSFCIECVTRFGSWTRGGQIRQTRNLTDWSGPQHKSPQHTPNTWNGSKISVLKVSYRSNEYGAQSRSALNYVMVCIKF
jgi:hypothetical protein